MPIRCDECDQILKNAERQRSHYRDHHINEVFYGESLTSLSKTSGNFECPLCASKMKTSRGILRHLSVQHEVKGGYDKKKQNAAEDMEDCEHVPPPPIIMELEA